MRGSPKGRCGTTKNLPSFSTTDTVLYFSSRRGLNRDGPSANIGTSGKRCRMSGHSKWHSIKHKKAAADAKRGKAFTQVIKEITVAARLGGGDPNFNPRLRLVVDKAKSLNMPKENIDRAIKKGTGELEGYNLEEVIYEGYGPGGVAVLIEATTNNRNRTVGEVRHLFSKYGGNLGETGSVGWMFHKKGYIVVERKDAREEELLEIVLEAGGEDDL